ncbi:MAG: A24 family peptidase [Rickettsiales bacterium]|nr:A24 family peptidase [Rickettsiales bacterium]
MFLILNISLIALAAILGIFVPHIASKIVASTPGTWADILMNSPPLEGCAQRARGGLATYPLCMAFATAITILISPANPILITAAVFLFALATAIDLRARLIPDTLTFPLIILGALLAPNLPWINGGITEGAIAALIGYILASLMGVVYYKKSPTAIGGGDIKLIAVGGMFLGITGLSVALVVSAISAYIISVIPAKAGISNCNKSLPGLTGQSRQNKFIPFAPFFTIGMLSYIIYWNVCISGINLP